MKAYAKYLNQIGRGRELNHNKKPAKRQSDQLAAIILGGIIYFMSLFCSFYSFSQTASYVTIDLPPNSLAVYLIANNNIDIEVRVLNDGKFVSSQNGPQKLMGLEYVVLQTKDKPQSFNIEVNATHQAGFTPSWQVTEVPIAHNSDIVALYQALYQASQWWGSKKTQAKIDALELVARQLKLVEQSRESYWQALIVYTSMLASFNRYAESFALLDKVLRQQPDIPWQYAYSLHWLRVDAKQMLDERAVTVELYRPLIAMADWQNQISGVLLRQTQVLGDYGIAQMLWGWSGNNKALIEQGRADVEQALSLAAQYGDYLMLSNFHNHMWTYWAINKNLDEGEKSLLLALDFAKRSEEQNATVWILIHLAKKYQLAGQTVQSLHTFRQALALINQTESEQSKANILYGIAEGYRQLGERRLAKRFYQRALDSYHTLEVARGEAKSHFALGRMALDEKAYDKAISYHQASYEFYKRHSPQDTAKGLLALAQDHLYAGDKLKAKALADEVSEQQADILLGADKLDGLLILAEIAWHNGEYEQYERHIAAINRGFSEQLQPKQQLKLAALITAELSRTMDIAYLQQHLAKVSEQVLAIGELLVTDENGAAWRAHVDGVLNQFVVALMGFANKLPEQAQSAALKSQVFDLLERFGSVNLRQRRAYLAAGTFEPEQSTALSHLWQQTLAAQKQLVDAQTQTEQAQARLALDVAREAYLRYRPRHVEPIQAKPLAVLSLTQLQQALAPDEMLLRYYLREDIGFVFVVAKDRWRVMSLPPKAVLTEQLSAMLRSIKSQQPLGAEQNRFFRQLLPAELFADSTIKQLLVVQDDILGALPLTAINIAEQHSRYRPLVSRFDVTRIYSASDYFAEHSLPASGSATELNSDIAIFADPVFDPEQLLAEVPLLVANHLSAFRSWQSNLARLSWTKAEAQAIAATFSHKKVTIVEGVNATSEALMSPQMRSASILHIASHGYFNPEVPEVVGIATAKSANEAQGAFGFLSLTALLQQPFSSRLVVISGCDTLLGEQLSGEGFNSLTRGVLAQGAGSVISTLWSIADKPTAEFMKHFYRHLKQQDGNSAKALNLTQRQFATQGRYRSALYWAGFVLTSSHRQFEQAIETSY